MNDSFDANLKVPRNEQSSSLLKPEEGPESINLIFNLLTNLKKEVRKLDGLQEQRKSIYFDIHLYRKCFGG
jgi:hypothetical protein